MSCVCDMSQVVACCAVIKNMLPSTLLCDILCCMFLSCVLTGQNSMLTFCCIRHVGKMLHVVDVVAIQLAMVTHDNSN